jgi:hypothetical protein
MAKTNKKEGLCRSRGARISNKTVRLSYFDYKGKKKNSSGHSFCINITKKEHES